MAVAAALLLALTAASGCAAPGTQRSPLPDRFAPVWSADVETDFNAGGVTATLFVISGSAVVLPVPGGDLTVRDPSTGRIRWSVAPDPGWRFSGDGVIGRRLYTYMTTPSANLTRFAAYDLGTGQIVWQTALVVKLYQGIGLQEAMITSRGIVVQLGAANALYGLRLSDGKGTWLTRLPADCPSGDGTGAPSAAVFLLQCTGSGVRLLSVDPASGRISWRRVLAVSRTDVYPIDLHTTDNGDVVAEAGTTMRIFAPNGRLIATRVPPRSCPGGSCMIGSNGSGGVLELGTNNTVVQGIDLASGRLRWQRAGELIGFGDSAIPVGSDGTMFAAAGQSLIGDRPELLPAFVLAISTTTGRSAVLPLPLASAAGGSVLAGTAAGLLFVQSEGPRNPFITAFRPQRAALGGPAALGGVPAARWPDACTLVTPGDLRFIAAGYVFAKRPVTLSGVTWPKPVTCAYVGPAADDPAVTVTVGWIAASTQQAHELLTSELAALSGINQPPPAIPGGYLVYDGGINGGVDRALVVAGRAIVEVTVAGHPDDARRLAPIVAARLRAYG